MTKNIIKFSTKVISITICLDNKISTRQKQEATVAVGCFGLYFCLISQFGSFLFQLKFSLFK